MDFRWLGRVSPLPAATPEAPSPTAASLDRAAELGFWVAGDWGGILGERRRAFALGFLPRMGMRGGAMDNVGVAVDGTGDDVLLLFVKGNNDGDDGNNVVRDEIPPDARWAESKEGKEGGTSSSVSSPPVRSPLFLLSPSP